MSLFRGKESGPEETHVSRTSDGVAPDTAPTRSTSVAAGTRIEGKVTGSTQVVVDGVVAGEIKLNSRLVIGASGEVHGDVAARAVQVSGKLVGNARAEERIELEATGSIEGDVAAPRVVIAEGGFCKGKIEMSQPSASKPTGQKPSQSPPNKATSGS